MSDKRITLEITRPQDTAPTVLTGWLEDWILALYDAMPEDQRRTVRMELKRRAEREKIARRG
jgi:hypothetical protein